MNDSTCRKAPRRASSTVHRGAADIVCTDRRLKTSDGVDELFLRRKHGILDGGRPPVLFVHGATYASSMTFDFPVEGFSWMDTLAAAGFDVYSLDLRGYGQSSRPAAMFRRPEENPPIVDSATALTDVLLAVETILAETAAARTSLIGWSWGTTLCAALAACRPDLVDRLVLFAPLWTFEGPAPIPANTHAYRMLTADDARARWFASAPDNQRNLIISDDVFEAWSQAVFPLDPFNTGRVPPSLRVPNGVVRDIHMFWAKGRPTYDPEAIVAPTLLIRGALDRDTPAHMALELKGRLTATAARYVEIPNLTHMGLLEQPRRRLFDAVEGFLVDELPVDR